MRVTWLSREVIAQPANHDPFRRDYRTSQAPIFTQLKKLHPQSPWHFPHLKITRECPAEFTMAMAVHWTPPLGSRCQHQPSFKWQAHEFLSQLRPLGLRYSRLQQPLQRGDVAAATGHHAAHGLDDAMVKWTGAGFHTESHPRNCISIICGCPLAMRDNPRLWFFPCFIYHNCPTQMSPTRIGESTSKRSVRCSYRRKDLVWFTRLTGDSL